MLPRNDIEYIPRWYQFHLPHKKGDPFLLQDYFLEYPRWASQGDDQNIVAKIGEFWKGSVHPVERVEWHSDEWAREMTLFQTQAPETDSYSIAFSNIKKMDRYSKTP
jgi:hypothetical protein